MDKRLVSLSLLLISIFIVATIIIAYGRGYRPDIKDKKLKPTGLLVATSTPDGAQVFINGKLKTATNNTINLAPGWYDVKIQKDGYFPWEKKLRIQGEIVTKTDALLLPTTPSLRALTNSGALNPVLSPLGNRIVYGTATGSAEKIGVYVTDLVERPIIGGNTRQISRDTIYVNLSQANFLWSPDGKRIMAYFKKTQIPNSKTQNQEELIIESAYLLDIDRFNEVPEDITLTYETILEDWQKEIELNEKQRINSLKSKTLRKIVKSWKILSWSPDETKILYTATASATLPIVIKPPLIGTNSQKESRNLDLGKVYVYDIKEDKNFEIGSLKEMALGSSLKTSPFFGSLNYLINQLLNYSIQWHPSSRHLVLTEKDKISVMEYDRTNKTVIYAGPFADNFVFPWPDGSRLVILTSYNPVASPEPNLYTISLR